MINLFDLKGKKASFYNSFNGERGYFTIDELDIANGVVIVRGMGNWGREEIRIPTGIIEGLIAKGWARVDDELDHCYIYKEYKIYE